MLGRLLKILKSPTVYLTVAFLLIICALINSYVKIPSEFTNFAWFALCVITLIYAYATIYLVFENRKTIKEMRQARLDAVRPALSLQPGHFSVGGTALSLYLTNSGGVARGVMIDIEITKPSHKVALFISAINREHKVDLLGGISINDIYREGGKVLVCVTFKDIYNQSLSETLSLDFSELTEDSGWLTGDYEKKGRGRVLRGEHSDLQDIRKALENIKDQLSSIERKFK